MEDEDSEDEDSEDGGSEDESSHRVDNDEAADNTTALGFMKLLGVDIDTPVAKNCEYRFNYIRLWKLRLGHVHGKDCFQSGPGDSVDAD